VKPLISRIGLRANGAAETDDQCALSDWSLTEVVTALTEMRGFDLISASAFTTEMGDLSQFPTAQTDGPSRLS
jgi:hypothetical protein